MIGDWDKVHWGESKKARRIASSRLLKGVKGEV